MTCQTSCAGELPEALSSMRRGTRSALYKIAEAFKQLPETPDRLPLSATRNLGAKAHHVAPLPCLQPVRHRRVHQHVDRRAPFLGNT